MGENQQGFNLVFSESAGGYQQRTYENARLADITVQFKAVDSYGERATENAAGARLVSSRLVIQNGKIVNEPVQAAEILVSQLPYDYRQGKPCSVNLAGNGIYTLHQKFDISQSDIDEYISSVFVEMRSRGFNVSSLRSGGQTGVDESVVAVGRALDVPVEVHAPKGWLFRGLNGDISGNEELFKKRFEKHLTQERSSQKVLFSRYAQSNCIELSSCNKKTVVINGREFRGRDYSAFSMVYDPGTTLTVKGKEYDVSGKSVEEVYQTVIKGYSSMRSGKGKEPSCKSPLFGWDKEQFARRGYLPLVAIYASQHPDKLSVLRDMVDSLAVNGPVTLTDRFWNSGTMACQAVAWAKLLNGEKFDFSIINGNNGLCQTSENEKGRLYVTYYGSRDIPENAFRVCISTSCPQSLKGKIDVFFKSAYPDFKQMVGPHKAGEIDDAEYTARYRKSVLEPNREKILDAVRKMQQMAREKGKDVYMFCYCAPGAFCHRYLLNNFLNENGIRCEENPGDRLKYSVGKVRLYGEVSKEENLCQKYSNMINNCSMVYPGTNNEIWHFKPYTVKDIQMSKEGHIEYITISNGNNKEVVITGSHIDSENRLVLKMQGVTFKYDLSSGKVFFPQMGESMVLEQDRVVLQHNPDKVLDYECVSKDESISKDPQYEKSY